MRTPRWFFEFLEEHLAVKFMLDAAADDDNAMCSRYLTERTNSLRRRWVDWTFCNPPFMMMAEFLRHGHEEATRYGHHTVMLAPAVGSQDWAREYVRQWTELRPDRRICYDNPDGSPTNRADRDTAIVIMGPGFENPRPSPYFEVVNLALPKATRTAILTP